MLTIRRGAPQTRDVVASGRYASDDMAFSRPSCACRSRFGLSERKDRRGEAMEVLRLGWIDELADQEVATASRSALLAGGSRPNAIR